MKYSITETAKQIVYIISPDRDERDYGFYEVDQHLVSYNNTAGDTPMNEKSIGQIFAIAQRSPQEGSDTLIFRNDTETIENGWCGNSDASIRRHFGWRGTTNNVGIYAMGTAKLVSYNQHPHTYRTIVKFDRIQIND